MQDHLHQYEIEQDLPQKMPSCYNAEADTDADADADADTDAVAVCWVGLVYFPKGMYACSMLT